MNIAPYIDHTLLKPTTSVDEVAQLCKEAIESEFAAVCIPPYYVKKASDLVEGTAVKVATVIGFPFGYSTTKSKLEEIIRAIEDGVDEMDIVHNIAALKAGDWEYLEFEIKAAIELAHSKGKIIKLIVESGVLTEEELIKCCEVYPKYHIDFMKTSTGYAETGATVKAVKIMRKHLPASISIKASGGIRNFAFARELIDAGASRLGCSASIKILEESLK